MKELDLAKFYPIFEEQELLDPTSICELTEEDLKEIGFSTIGARKKMNAAILKLRQIHNLGPESDSSNL